MMRRWTIALAAAAGALVQARADVTIRGVTFNTYQGIDDTPQARLASGHLLTTLDLDGNGPNTSLMPTFVCLQETTSLSSLNSFRDDYLPGHQVRKGTITDGFYSQAFFYPGDWTLVKFNEFSTPGPRPTLRAVFQVPEADDYLVVYNAHFKSGQEAGDVSQRAAEANAIANQVASDLHNGIDINGDLSPDFTPEYYLFMGDLNQDDFSSTTIDPLLVGGSNGLPTGLNDVRFETLLGAAQSSFWVGDSYSTRSTLDRRYDYVLASDAIFESLDTNGNGTVSQNELNAAGFVYISADDLGQQASGDVDATTDASDHAPAVFSFTMPGGAGGLAGDVDGDGDVDLNDLSLLLVAFGSTSSDGNYNPDADFDGDGDVDLGDLSTLLANYGL